MKVFTEPLCGRASAISRQLRDWFLRFSSFIENFRVLFASCHPLTDELQLPGVLG